MSSAAKTPLISVVIPTLGKPDLLELTLESLYRQTLPHNDYEVIVVACTDDATTQSRCELHLLRDWNFTLLLEERRGRSRARNRGLAMASGPYTLFVDDDSICPPTLLESHLRQPGGHAVIGQARFVFSRITLDKPSFARALNSSITLQGNRHLAHSLESVIANESLSHSVVVISRDDVQFDFAKIERLSTSNGPGDPLSALPQRINAGQSPAPWSAFATLHCGAPTSQLRAVGGFDEGMSGWGEEDPELGFRLFQNEVPFIALESPTVFNQMHGPDRFGLAWEWSRNYVRAASRHKTLAWALRWRLVLGFLDEDAYDKKLLQATDSEVASIWRDYIAFSALVEKLPPEVAPSLTMALLARLGHEVTQTRR